ncbi:MAG: ATP-binding protein [Clostridia bacterium]|nr:ATP-binding protein [Clostridia bacterium]
MFKRRLYLYYISLILISLIISGLIIAQVSVNKYKAQVEAELRTNAGAAAYFIEENNPADYNEFAVLFSKKLNSFVDEDYSVRVTVVKPDGVVIGDSVADIAKMDNHRLRPELITAAHENIGVSVRRSDTTKIEYMYLAVKLKDGNFVRLSVALSYIKSLTSTIYLYTFIGILISLAVSVLIGWSLSRSFAKPISKLSEHAEEISKGNYSHRIAREQKHNELSRLIESFNGMTEELEQSFSEASDRNRELSTLLNTINESIIAVNENYEILFANERIKVLPGFDLVESGGNISLIKNSGVLELIETTMAEKNTVQKEINSYNLILSCFASYFELDDGAGVIISLQDITRIKQLERLRYEFVSNVTHELNTPLTSIKGFIETLKEGAIKDTVTAMKFLNIIEIESERLSNLINDILTLSSIENENVLGVREQVNLRSIANDALILLSNSISDKEIKVTNDIDSSIYVSADSDRIKQLFINLIDNSVKYNVRGGKVDIYTINNNGIVEIHVKDTGIGIDDAHKSRLFERFYRVDKGRSREMGGTGLGLSIVKHIAILYDGSVSVESKVGEGSDFCITLPVV